MFTVFGHPTPGFDECFEESCRAACSTRMLRRIVPCSPFNANVSKNRAVQPVQARRASRRASRRAARRASRRASRIATSIDQATDNTPRPTNNTKTKPDASMDNTVGTVAESASAIGIPLPSFISPAHYLYLHLYLYLDHYVTFPCTRTRTS